MSLENSVLNSEGENKINDLTEEEKELELKKTLEFKLQKEKIGIEVEAENEVFKLKELIDSGLISEGIINKVISGEEITTSEIQEIFDKIDEIEDIKNIDNYLPRNLRITHEEYKKALNDSIFRAKMIIKLNTALVLLSDKINPYSTVGINLFSGFVTLLDKNLIKVQENTIDIKNELKNIDEKITGKNIDNRTFLQKIIDFIKEIFS